ncbi:hypothetical protein PRIPAC_70045 [Pristionchus pacificus]|uniref:Uncharacterized protein n=1 Tax=Pristionchus pacificus TaxID=54126 RepID=A0A2A6CQX5_PRIPA|nr:hypothetical protein PRIPAC_70045 [Pristionchus pacificus]|eukprot:PDM80615.1 hypothetical protein PRIPAC_35618 [Pristionchus pacificus]
MSRRPTIGNTVCKRTESLQWTNTEILASESSANFLDGTVSPISKDSSKFIRALIFTSISIGKSARATLWRWNLTRSSPQQMLSMLSNCRMDRSLFSPMDPICKNTKLSELDVIDFPSLSPSTSAYLNKWIAFERSGSNDLLAFIGIETAKKILHEAAIANDSEDLIDVSTLLQGALILGAILTTRRSEMLLSMSFSIWTLMQVAHSQIHDIGFEKKRVWSILNGLTTKKMCGIKQLSNFLDSTLPGNLKREHRQTLVNSLRDILLTRTSTEEEGMDEGEGGRSSANTLEERRELNILSSSKISPSHREKMHSLSPPKLDRFSPEKAANEVDGFVSSRDGDYFTPYVSPSHFDDLSMTREETPYVNVNEERKKKMGRKRRSDNWRRIGKVPLDGSPKGSTSHEDEPVILGMFYELRMKREEEWEREMEVISRPMRAKKPVKLFDPTPTTPKKRSSSRGKIEQSIDLDMSSVQKIAGANEGIDHLDNSEDDKYEGRTKSEDALYVIVNRRRRRRSRDDRMDGNEGMTPINGEYVVRSLSKEKEDSPRTIRNKTPIWKELPIQMPPLINVNGVIQLGERTDEAVEGMIKDERRMEERNENDNDDIGIEDIQYSGPLDEHSYAKIGDGEAIYEDIIDVITVDGDVDLGQNGNSFKMDEDVEEIHEIIGEDGVEEIIIPMEENMNEVNGIDPQMDMDEYEEE